MGGCNSRSDYNRRATFSQNVSQTPTHPAPPFQSSDPSNRKALPSPDTTSLKLREVLCTFTECQLRVLLHGLPTTGSVVEVPAALRHDALNASRVKAAFKGGTVHVSESNLFFPMLSDKSHHDAADRALTSGINQPNAAVAVVESFPRGVGVGPSAHDELRARLDALTLTAHRRWNTEWFAARSELMSHLKNQENYPRNEKYQSDGDTKLMDSIFRLRKIQSDFFIVADTVFRSLFDPISRVHLAKIVVNQNYKFVQSSKEKTLQTGDLSDALPNYDGNGFPGVRLDGLYASDSYHFFRNTLSTSLFEDNGNGEPLRSFNGYTRPKVSRCVSVLCEQLADALATGNGADASAILMDWCYIGLEVFGLRVRLVQSLSDWKKIKKELNSCSTMLTSSSHACPPLGCLLSSGGCGFLATAPIPDDMFRSMSCSSPAQCTSNAFAVALECYNAILNRANPSQRNRCSDFLSKLVNADGLLSTFVLTSFPAGGPYMKSEKIINCALSQLGSCFHLTNAAENHPSLFLRSIRASLTVLSERCPPSYAPFVFSDCAEWRTAPVAGDRKNPSLSRTIVLFTQGSDVRLYQAPASGTFRHVEQLIYGHVFKGADPSTILRFEPLSEDDGEGDGGGGSRFAAEVYGRHCAIWSQATTASPTGTIHVLSSFRTRRRRSSGNVLRDFPWDSEKFAILAGPSPQVIRSESYDRPDRCPPPLFPDVFRFSSDVATLHEFVHASGWNMNNALWRIWLGLFPSDKITQLYSPTQTPSDPLEEEPVLHSLPAKLEGDANKFLNSNTWKAHQRVSMQTSEKCSGASVEVPIQQDIISLHNRHVHTVRPSSPSVKVPLEPTLEPSRLTSKIKRKKIVLPNVQSFQDVVLREQQFRKESAAGGEESCVPSPIRDEPSIHYTLLNSPARRRHQQCHSFKNSACCGTAQDAQLRELVACDLVAAALVQILRKIANDGAAHVACENFDLSAAEKLFAAAVVRTANSESQKGCTSAYDHLKLTLWLNLLTAEQHIDLPCPLTPAVVNDLWTIVASSAGALRLCVRYRCGLDIRFNKGTRDDVTELRKSIRERHSAPPIEKDFGISASPLPYSKVSSLYSGAVFAAELMGVLGYQCLSDLLPLNHRRNRFINNVPTRVKDREFQHRPVDPAVFLNAAAALVPWNEDRVVSRLVLCCHVCYLAATLEDGPLRGVRGNIFLKAETSWEMHATALILAGLLFISENRMLRAKLCFFSALIILINFNGDPRSRGVRGSSGMMYPLWVSLLLLLGGKNFFLDTQKLENALYDMFRVCRYSAGPGNSCLPLPLRNLRGASRSRLLRFHVDCATPNLWWLFQSLPANQSWQERSAERNDRIPQPQFILDPEFVHFWDADEVSDNNEEIFAAADLASTRIMLQKLDMTQSAVTVGETRHFTQLWTWGDNSNGCLGLGDDEAVYAGDLEPVLVPFKDTTIKAVASGETHVAAATANGLFTWGRSRDGALGLGVHTSYTALPTRVSLRLTVRAISCGPNFTACIASPNGIVFTWGCNTSGQLGYETQRPENFSAIPTRVIGIPPLQELSCGGAHCLGVSEEGFLYSWGDGTYGQLGIPPQCISASLRFGENKLGITSPARLRVYELPSAADENDFYASEIAQKLLCPQTVHHDRVLWREEPGTGMRIAVVTDKSFKVPADEICKHVREEVIFMNVSAGGQHSMALDLSNFAWTWGSGMHGQLGIPLSSDSESEGELWKPICPPRNIRTPASYPSAFGEAEMRLKLRSTPCRLSRASFSGHRILRGDCSKFGTSAIDDHYTLWIWGNIAFMNEKNIGRSMKGSCGDYLISDGHWTPVTPKAICAGEKVTRCRISWDNNWAVITKRDRCSRLFRFHSRLSETQPCDEARFGCNSYVAKLNEAIRNRPVDDIYFGKDFLGVLFKKSTRGGITNDASSDDGEE